MVEFNTKKILKELPSGVSLVAAVKGRPHSQIETVVKAGVKFIGENYLKQARDDRRHIGSGVKWHFIGHLQTNKARKAVQIFDMIQTLDSLRLAEVLDFECKRINKKIPVLIEVNSASEPQKYGLLPGQVADFVEKISNLSYLEPKGLMTMGPFAKDPEFVRPYFRKTKLLFDDLRRRYKEKLDWRYLSMGMSATYKIAIQEGANIVRVGSALFESQ